MAVEAMSEQRYCITCGQSLLPSRDEVIATRVDTWRRWCQDNRRRITPDDRVPPGVAAELTGADVNTLRNRRYAGEAPRFSHVGKLVMYDLRDLADWITARDV